MSDTPNLSKKSGMVALLGRPNVGKSTFLNALLNQEISIVTPKAQTTRNQIRGILNEAQGQIVFLDTPGLHRAKEVGINAFMLEEAKNAIEGSDLLLYLIDPYSNEKAETWVLDYLTQVRDIHQKPIIVVINKIDLVKKASLTQPAKMFSWLQSWTEQLSRSPLKVIRTFEISARKKSTLSGLLQFIYEQLPIAPALYDDVEVSTDRPLRFIVAELVRKQLFLQMGDEIPYSCAVEIEQYKDEDSLTRIHAVIIVERESQKGMVIGQKGVKIKTIGIKAREDIEKLIERKVHLQLYVKVVPSWSSKVHSLKQMGYHHESK